MKTISSVLVILIASVSFAFPQMKGKPVIQTVKPAAFATSAKALPFAGIKAVLIAGPVEELTPNAIDRARAIAAFLEKKGVKVIELYDPDATWASVVIASEGAHIFLYSGHGTTMGFGGKPGGLCLSNGSMIAAATMVKELHLHKNALILFHTVCMGAGSSASDDHEIDANEALQRVSDYAHAFIQLGAGGYYANNYSGSMVAFLDSFFEKKTMKEIYTEEASRYCKIETFKKYAYDTAFQVSVAASTSKSGTATRTTWINGIKKTEEIPVFKSYDIAFVGRPGFSFEDLTR